MRGLNFSMNQQIMMWLVKTVKSSGLRMNFCINSYSKTMMRIVLVMNSTEC